MTQPSRAPDVFPGPGAGPEPTAGSDNAAESAARITIRTAEDGAAEAARSRRRRVRACAAAPSSSTDASGGPGSLSAEEARVLRTAGLTLGEEMGRGAHGPVLRCLDAEGRDVVLRCIDLPEGRAGAAILRRLAELRDLRHPGIVPVREVMALPGQRAAVIVDLVPGADLGVVLGARGHLEAGELATLLDAVGSALAHLHERGGVHGDVAPGNVVITPDGGPVLVDLLGGVRETGTAGYAAPERVGGGPPTAATDVYALAVLVAAASVRSGAWVATGTVDRNTAETMTVPASVLDRVLGDALAAQPGRRPTARALAARAPELGRDAPITLPDGPRLAAGALRAAAAAPTRAVPRRSTMRGARLAPRTGSKATAGRGSVLRRTALVLGIAFAVGLAVAGPCRPIVAGLATAAGLSTSAGTIGATATALASGAASAAPAPPGAEGSAAGAASASEGGAAGAPTVDLATLREVVVDLTSRRDDALEAADATALADTTVEGSPARASNDAVLEGLAASGEIVSGLNSEVRAVSVAEVPAEAAATWPDASAARVTLAQAASTRSGPSGTRTVPALAAREVVLILVPGPWRVAEVRAIEE